MKLDALRYFEVLKAETFWRGHHIGLIGAD